LDGGSVRRKAAADTEQHKQNKRTQTSMPLVEFEPTIPVFERVKTVHALDRGHCDQRRHSFFCFLGWGETVHLVRRPLIGLLYQPRMIDDDECGAIGGMRIGRGNRSTWRKSVPMQLCPPQIPHDLDSNLGRRGGKPANNHLNYGTTQDIRVTARIGTGAK
jgi:hypothetical protein